MTRVERLREDDWAVFRELRLRSLLDSPEAFGSTYGDESSWPERPWRDWAAGRWRGGTAVVFTGRADDGAAVGTATGADYDAEAGVAHVYAMWVAPGARGAGVGRALLHAVADWARDRGCDRLVLSVTESNETARRFYDACGFVDTGERVALREGSEMHTLILSKPL
ncbi:MAG TPA: GNAT family N-acetyltransferase [Actinomycetota bacterium]|jgi:GNAT superfamily N-acetyltransferase|nr:GNAT family N-acetyltransferase [Actinomycetota bacterium]